MKTTVRVRWIGAGLVFIANLGMTLFFLPDQLSWANSGVDGGDYLAAVLTRGVPHPTGYPTYVLLNILFQDIPFSTPYWRGTFFSACMAALSGALLFLWLWSKLKADLPSNQSSVLEKGGLGLFAAVGLGCLAWTFSPFLISQALIVDVHSLQAVFFVLGLFWIDELATAPQSWKASVLALFFGLGLGNHITLLILLPPVCLTAFLRVPRPQLLKILAAQAAAICLGLSVYLYLPWSASHAPAVNWGNPQNLPGFLWLVGGTAYQGMLWQFDIASLLTRAATGGRFFFQQLGPFGLAIAALGTLRGRILGREIAWSLAWCAASSVLFALTYGALDWTTYLLPALIVCCAWISAGVDALWNWRWSSLPAGKLLSLACLAWLLLQLPAVLRSSDPRSATAAADYAARLLAEAPRGALIITSQDLDTFPLWYYHLGLKLRPDLHVILDQLTVFRWYRETIRHTYPDLSIPSGEPPDDVAWEGLLARANPELPVCTTSIETSSSQPAVTFSCLP